MACPTEQESKFGHCDCGFELTVDEWFWEKEFKPYSNIPTGRKRLAASCLVCLNCGKRYPVDDTFDGPWQYD